MHLTLLTSGTTKSPKEITHTWNFINQCIDRSVHEIGLTYQDTVLDVFPGNTIAHYTVTAIPALKTGAKLVSAKFDAIDYLEKFNHHRPTYIALIPRHWEILKEHTSWKNLDMSCVRYMVTGSGAISQEMIDDFLSKGVKIVANWYGMTEYPPPVFIGYNSECFDFTTKNGVSIEFSDEGECIIDGFATGDLFDVHNKKFLRRKLQPGGSTWKTM
jgi:long-subunit acyl-CoA synthetase (AMP-forming)